MIRPCSSTSLRFSLFSLVFLGVSACAKGPPGAARQPEAAEPASAAVSGEQPSAAERPEANALPAPEAPAAAPARPIEAEGAGESLDRDSKASEGQKAGAAKRERAAAKPKAASADDQAEASVQVVMELYRMLEDNEQQLSESLALASPDCPKADAFRRAVCDLSERICSLESELPDTTAGVCGDARNRCTAANTSYRQHCK